MIFTFPWCLGLVMPVAKWGKLADGVLSCICKCMIRDMKLGEANNGPLHDGACTGSIGAGLNE